MFVAQCEKHLVWRFCLSYRQVSFFAISIASYEESLPKTAKSSGLMRSRRTKMSSSPSSSSSSRSPRKSCVIIFFLILKSGKIPLKRGECDEFPLRLPLYIYRETFDFNEIHLEETSCLLTPPLSRPSRAEARVEIFNGETKRLAPPSSAA